MGRQMDQPDSQTGDIQRVLWKMCGQMDLKDRWINRWIDGQTDKWKMRRSMDIKDKQTKNWMNGQANRWMRKYTNIWTDIQMRNGWIDEFKGQVNEQLDGRTERPIDIKMDGKP